MNSTKTFVVIGSVILVVLGGGLGAWMVATAPPANLEAWKEQQCNEYVKQLELVNQYKMFWSFIQRRVAFNDCLSRIESGERPMGGAQP